MTIDIPHTPACLEAKAHFDAWVQQWPNYCEWCGAQGWRYHTFDTCPHCFDRGICPRCKWNTLVDQGTGEARCSRCGWLEDDPSGALPAGECLCEEETK